MIDLVGLGYITWYFFSTVLLITSIAYFISRKGLRNPKILWWINILLIITSVIILGLLTDWGYWRGSEGGEPGEAFGAFVSMIMFWVPVFFYLIDIIMLLIFRPVKNIEKTEEAKNE